MLEKNCTRDTKNQDYRSLKNKQIQEVKTSGSATNKSLSNMKT